MIPVRDGEDELLIIFVREIRIVDDEGCSETIGVLSFVVGMIPISTSLIDLRMSNWVHCHSNETYCEIVGKLRPRGDSTLRDLSWSIHLCGAILKKTMEVEGGTLITQLIVDIDDNLITLGRCHHW